MAGWYDMTQAISRIYEMHVMQIKTLKWKPRECGHGIAYKIKQCFNVKQWITTVRVYCDKMKMMTSVVLKSSTSYFQISFLPSVVNSKSVIHLSNRNRFRFQFQWNHAIHARNQNQYQVSGETVICYGFTSETAKNLEKWRHKNW